MGLVHFSFGQVNFQEYWDRLSASSWYGNAGLRWVIASAVAVILWVVLRIAKSVLHRRMEAWSGRWKSEWPEAVAALLAQTRFWFLTIESLYLGSLVLDLPDKVRSIIGSIAIITLLIQAALWGNATLTFWLNRYVKRRIETDAAAVTTISAIGFLGRLVLWSLVLLLGLANLGVDITALIAGLGVGGVAVALAAQNILGDLFASLSIVLDKPFVMGDFIIVGDYMGTVEHVGLKTTRVRSLSGEQLVFSNNDLLQSRIRNYKRMQERRVVFSLGVTYDTPHEKLAAIPAAIREIVESQEQTRFDRTHFKEYGDSSLKFEIVYYMLTADYNIYMDVQQAINLEIYRKFEQDEIEFAYPTRTLYVKRAGEADEGIAGTR